MNHRAYIANIECRVNTEGLLGGHRQPRAVYKW